MPLTLEQQKKLEAKKAEIAKKIQANNQAFGAAVHASGQIQQYNDHLGHTLDKVSKGNIKLAGKDSEHVKGFGCEII